MRTLDRYLIRESVGPFFLALGLFTFVLAVRPMLENAQLLLSKGVPVPTVGFLLMTLLPQALGLTIPMAFLAGLLMAFGRLSGDRETVALLACGVNPLRLLVPALVLGTVVAGITLYVMVDLVPDSNQKFREVTAQFAAQTAETDIKPQMFYEGFPGKVLYIQGAQQGEGWQEVLLADTTEIGSIKVILAQRGHLVLDKEAKIVNIVLDEATEYVPGAEPGVYTVRPVQQAQFQVDPRSIFGDGVITRGLPEMSIAELRKNWLRKVAVTHESPHSEIIYIHQKFSFPTACLIFALLGVSFGFHTRREGKLGGLTLGLGGILIYYALMAFAEAGAKAPTHWFNPHWARWFPNIVMGVAGIVAVGWRARATGQDLTLRVPEWLVRRFQKRDQTRTDGLPAPARSRVVIVIKIPRMTLPRPRLLDLYVSRQYVTMIVLSLVGLVGLYYIGTVVDMSEKLFKGRADSHLLGLYLWYATPRFLSYAVPAATLVAVLGTIGGLTRSSELTVMRSCGISLYRAALPLVALALVWSGFLFLLQERVMASSNKKADELEDTIRDRPHHTVNVANRTWLAANGRVYYYAAFEPAPKPQIHNLTIFETARRPYRLTRQTFAKLAVCLDRVCKSGNWNAQNGWVQQFASTTRTTQSAFKARPVTLNPVKDFTLAQVDPSSMTVGELLDYIKRSKASGFGVAADEVNLQGKFAFPAVTLVMTFLAIPFGVTTGRRGALYGIGLAIVLSVAYWLFTAFFFAAGSAGLLPAVLAAWATNVLFSALALYMVLTVRT
jgi:LPS export ABC transporter permease LptG/LPS export ABC transporter permease LptF